MSRSGNNTILCSLFGSGLPTDRACLLSQHGPSVKDIGSTRIPKPPATNMHFGKVIVLCGETLYDSFDLHNPHMLNARSVRDDFGTSKQLHMRQQCW